MAFVSFILRQINFYFRLTKRILIAINNVDDLTNHYGLFSGEVHVLQMQPFLMTLLKV